MQFKHVPFLKLCLLTYTTTYLRINDIQIISSHIRHSENIHIGALEIKIVQIAALCRGRTCYRQEQLRDSFNKNAECRHKNGNNVCDTYYNTAMLNSHHHPQSGL